VYDNTGLVSQVVELLARARAGLVTDIDGTISPIVAVPEDATVLPLARDALRGLKERLELVAVVTGRSVLNARGMVAVDGITYIGNHGFEVLRDGQAEVVPEAQPWVPRLRAVLNRVASQLDDADGVVIEEKGPTASLHYRLSPDPDAMREQLLELLATSPDVRLEEGRRVINLLPPLAISKGSAVTWLVHEHELDSIVYLGDDVTDAHAFQALDALRQSAKVRALRIGVVGPETPSIVRQLSDASVPTVTAAAELLAETLECLKTSDRMKFTAPIRRK
jgi:trehalose 6-phosphate phosphatase